MTAPLLHLADLPLLPRPDAWAPPADVAQRIAMRSGRIGSALGLTHLGCSLVAVPPGKQAFPFHNHRHNDELFVVLDGTGELRYGSSRHPLRAGDVVGCPAGGPETAHAITNTGPTELRYLAFSSQHTPEICDYPDSGKTGWFDDRPPTAHVNAPGTPPQTDHVLVRNGQVVDYWDGE